MRVLLVSWFVLLCMVVPIGAHILPAPTSDFTAGDAVELEEPSADDQALAGVVRIRKDKMVRKTVLLATTCSQRFCAHVSLSPPFIGGTVTASPRSSALRLHQLISVYRI